MTPNEQDAKDLTQRFFLRLVTTGKAQKLRYTLIDFLREENKFKAISFDDEIEVSVDVECSDIETNNYTLAQKFIIAFLGKGYTHREIAEIVGCSDALISKEMEKIRLGKKSRPVIEIKKPKVKIVFTKEIAKVIGMSVNEFIKYSVDEMRKAGVSYKEIAKKLGYSERGLRSFRSI
jgi:DNA-directed RNA polymerase specialized sigma24 family protein